MKIDIIIDIIISISLRFWF